MSVPSRIYKVLLELRSIFNRNFSSGLGNLKLRLNSIRSNVFIKIHGNFWVNWFQIKTFPFNVKNIQAGPNNFQDSFDFISRASRPKWNNNMQSGFISIRSGPLVVQPRYNMIPFESNNAQLVKFIFRTGNKIQVLHSLFNAQSGHNKRQSIRNYKKRRKERHDHNSESKQMNYERLLILCIILLYILLLLIKWNVTNHCSLLTIFVIRYG